MMNFLNLQYAITLSAWKIVESLTGKSPPHRSGIQIMLPYREDSSSKQLDVSEGPGQLEQIILTSGSRLTWVVETT